jgi:hypothetical protein
MEFPFDPFDYMEISSETIDKNKYDDTTYQTPLHQEYKDIADTGYLKDDNGEIISININDDRIFLFNTPVSLYNTNQNILSLFFSMG